ncbi:MAG: hypothetical protein JW384_00858 [Nitrosomonadaceae bacterium]|nr:hypothetical protein [Nitrosomonadaceae bacterium]
MKIPVPNICPTSGVSYEFRLAYGHLSNYLNRIEENESPRTCFLAKRSFLHRPISHYENYLNPEKYDGVITDKNREIIARINQLVDCINELRASEVADYEKLAPLHNTLDALISGIPMIQSE